MNGQIDPIQLMKTINELEYKISALATITKGWSFIPLTTALTSTSWDGDSFSTTAKTKIDLSAVFGVPAGIKAVYMSLSVKDSASQTTDTYIILDATDTASVGIFLSPQYVNDRNGRAAVIVPCNVDGDIYYQIAASGASTFDVIMRIWGYWI